MRKNRGKVSQTKPKNLASEQRSEAKALTTPKDTPAITDSFCELEIPDEPSYRIPFVHKKASVLVECSDGNKEKSFSNEENDEKSSEKPEKLSECSLSESGSTPRNIIGEYSELDLSHPKGLIQQIKELQIELTEMNQRINYTEEEMKSKEIEAMELKELLVKLRENQVMVMESVETKSNCRGCTVY